VSPTSPETPLPPLPRPKPAPASPMPLSALWKICQAFASRYRSFVPHSIVLPSRKSQTNLARLFPELGILNIRVKENSFSRLPAFEREQSSPCAPSQSPPNSGHFLCRKGDERGFRAGQTIREAWNAGPSSPSPTPWAGWPPRSTLVNGEPPEFR
jgi:hypothetical protein